MDCPVKPDNDDFLKYLLAGLIKEFLDAPHRGNYIPYSVIPACRESLWGKVQFDNTVKQKKKSGQAGMTMSLIPRPESLRVCGVVH